MERPWKIYCYQLLLNKLRLSFSHDKVKFFARSEFPSNLGEERQSFVDVVKHQVAVNDEGSASGHRSSGGGAKRRSGSLDVISKRSITDTLLPVVRRNVEENDGSTFIAPAILVDKVVKSALSEKNEGEACEGAAASPYFIKTLRIELLRGGGRKVYWALVRKANRVERSEGFKKKAQGPPNFKWVPKWRKPLMTHQVSGKGRNSGVNPTQQSGSRVTTPLPDPHSFVSPPVPLKSKRDARTSPETFEGHHGELEKTPLSPLRQKLPKVAMGRSQASESHAHNGSLEHSSTQLLEEFVVAGTSTELAETLQEREGRPPDHLSGRQSEGD